MFSEKVKSYAQDVSQNVLRNELLNDRAPAGPASGQDSLRSALLNIGAVDLAGETGAAVQQQKLDSLRNALVEKGEPGQAGINGSEHQHPYRRPTALKTVIDGHKKELDALYKKRFKSRVKLSGKMLVAFTIRTNGVVAGPSIVQSDVGDQIFEKDILKCIQAWKFRPVPGSVGDLTIQYPFEFP